MTERIYHPTWAEYTVEELHAVLDNARTELARCDEEHNAVDAHDMRCLIDQATAELERRDEEAPTE